MDLWCHGKIILSYVISCMSIFIYFCGAFVRTISFPFPFLISIRNLIIIICTVILYFYLYLFLYFIFLFFFARITHVTIISYILIFCSFCCLCHINASPCCTLIRDICVLSRIAVLYLFIHILNHFIILYII